MVPKDQIVTIMQSHHQTYFSSALATLSGILQTLSDTAHTTLRYIQVCSMTVVLNLGFRSTGLKLEKANDDILGDAGSRMQRLEPRVYS
jgi:hypothetical protein